MVKLVSHLILDPTEVTQTFPAYTLSQAQPQGALQPGAYQAVLPTGQTVVIHPSPQTSQAQQQQPQQSGNSINLTTVQVGC